MSGTLLQLSVALLFSAATLAFLALGDPKRLRALRREDARTREPLSSDVRRLLGWASLSPGVVLLAIGNGSAFLIWVSGATAMGWLLATRLAPRNAASHT